MSINIEKLSVDRRPFGNDEVKIIDCKNIIELISSSSHSKGASIRKLSANEYLNLNTGEVLPINHHDRRVDDTKSLSKTFSNARRIINANIINPSFCRFITLTYKDNIQDPKKVYNDFQNFWKKKLHKFFPHTEYIYAVEAQARGAWHIHLLLIFQETAPFIKNSDIEKMWGHGFTCTRAVDNVDNIGAYLSSYLTNLTLEECNSLNIKYNSNSVVDCNFFDEQGNSIKKKVVKGARLKYYPSGMRIFRYSKGIKKPDMYYTTAHEAETRVKDFELTYETTKQITDTQSGFINTINYRQYNKLRKENK